MIERDDRAIVTEAVDRAIAIGIVDHGIVIGVADRVIVRRAIVIEVGDRAIATRVVDHVIAITNLRIGAIDPEIVNVVTDRAIEIVGDRETALNIVAREGVSPVEGVMVMVVRMMAVRIELAVDTVVVMTRGIPAQSRRQPEVRGGWRTTVMTMNIARRSL